MIPDLTGKVVLITGAARGIGAATARAAAEAGARVALLGLEPDLLAALAADLAGLGPTPTWFECDVTDQAALSTGRSPGRSSRSAGSTWWSPTRASPTTARSRSTRRTRWPARSR